jgi:three-Cys-motif partner protein
MAWNSMPEAWLRKRIELIKIKEPHNCTEHYSNQFEPIQPWSLLKLAALRYLTSICLPIVERKLTEHYFRAIYYIDFFSGCAINRIQNFSTNCFGSPLLVYEVQKEKNKRFTKMFFNDNDSDKAYALEQCLSAVKKNDNAIDFEVTDKNANERVQEIKSKLLRKSYSLIFVDPYFTEFSWESMDTILNMYADIFFLYPTANMQRTLLKEEVDQQTQDFFKDYEKAKAIYEGTSNRSRKPLAVLDMYLEDVVAVRGRDNTRTETIRINGGSYYYDMLFISRRTAKGNPWWGGVTDLKNGLRGCDGDSVSRILSSDQSSLGDF